MEGITGNGISFVIYDTFCKSVTPEQKADADRKIRKIYRRSYERQYIEERMNQSEGSEK